jgi:hypothetical protein
VVLVAITAGSASAQPAPPAGTHPAKAADRASSPHDKHAPNAAGPQQKADVKAAQADARVEAKIDKAEQKAAAAEVRKTEAGHGAEGHRHFRNGLHRLHEDFKGGKLDKSQLRERAAKMRESTAERRNEHKQALRQRWGSALSLSPVRDELRQHARRMAFLDRALVLVETDDKVKDKKKLSERIEKLIAKETARHEQAMERWKATPPGPAPSGSALGHRGAL